MSTLSLSVVLAHLIHIMGKQSEALRNECSLENQGSWSLVFLLNATEKWK